MDMIATTFDIAMFLSKGRDCVQGIARCPPASSAQRSPSAAAEEQSDDGTPSKRSALAAVGCKAGLDVKSRSTVQGPNSAKSGRSGERRDLANCQSAGRWFAL